MKIIKKDKKIAAEEKLEKADLELEEKERKLTFARFKTDPMFQKHIIDGLFKKELDRITNIEWMYASENLGKSSNSNIGEVIRRNSVVYRVLRNFLKPIMED